MLHCKYVKVIKITHFIIIFPFTEFIYVAFTSRYSIFLLLAAHQWWRQQTHHTQIMKSTVGFLIMYY